MLRLLTDEHVSPEVARQARRRCRGIHIVALRDWEGGHYLSERDEVILREAFGGRWTIVTFDLRTIPPLLRRLAEEGVDHAGVILVDPRTLRQNDIGGITAALCALWRAQQDLDWTNRVVYLRR